MFTLHNFVITACNTSCVFVLSVTPDTQFSVYAVFIVSTELLTFVTCVCKSHAVCNIALIILGRVSSCSPKYWEIFSQIYSWLISGFIDVPSITESKKENID